MGLEVGVQFGLVMVIASVHGREGPRATLERPLWAFSAAVTAGRLPCLPSETRGSD